MDVVDAKLGGSDAIEVLALRGQMALEFSLLRLLATRLDVPFERLPSGSAGMAAALLLDGDDSTMRAVRQSIQLLNRIRNSIAHEITYDRLHDDASEFIDIVPKLGARHLSPEASLTDRFRAAISDLVYSIVFVEMTVNRENFRTEQTIRSLEHALDLLGVDVPEFHKWRERFNVFETTATAIPRK